MSRPEKLDADYFPHEKDFRNNLRVKALRRKFGLEGFAVLIMIQEVLTGSRCIQIELDPFHYEMLSGDFDINVEKLKPIIEYLLEINLVQIEDGFFRCNSLDASLLPLFEKRTTNLIELRKRLKPKNSNEGFQERKLSGNPHSKGKISKENVSLEKIEKKKRVSVSECEREGLSNGTEPGFHEVLKTFNSFKNRLSKCTIHEEAELDHLFTKYGYTVLDSAFNDMQEEGDYTIHSLKETLVHKNFSHQNIAAN